MNDDYYDRKVSEAQDGNVGADRAALGLSIIPDARRGDMNAVQSLTARLAALEKELEEAKELAAQRFNDVRNGHIYKTRWEEVSEDRDQCLIRAEKAEQQLTAAREENERKTALLKNVLKYHEWVYEEGAWHLEANAMAGLGQMLEDLRAALATGDGAKGKT